jgi:hypothetical protein
VVLAALDMQLPVSDTLSVVMPAGMGVPPVEVVATMLTEAMLQPLWRSAVRQFVFSIPARCSEAHCCQVLVDAPGGGGGGIVAALAAAAVALLAKSATGAVATKRATAAASSFFRPTPPWGSSDKALGARHQCSCPWSCCTEYLLVDICTGL